MMVASPPAGAKRTRRNGARDSAPRLGKLGRRLTVDSAPVRLHTVPWNQVSVAYLVAEGPAQRIVERTSELRSAGSHRNAPGAHPPKHVVSRDDGGER
jgi:hypothetical protein